MNNDFLYTFTRRKLKFIPVIVDYIFSHDNGEQILQTIPKTCYKHCYLGFTHKAMAIHDDLVLFQAIKSRLVKISDRNEGGTGGEEIETAIKQIISADTVIDQFGRKQDNDSINKIKMKIWT